MFSLILENRNGHQIELTNNKNYAVTEIDGLYPPGADIATSETSLYDGARYNSSKVKVRQLDIALSILRNVEENRIALYKVVKSKQHIIVRYRNGSRDVFIEGYVQDMNIDYFSNPQTVTVSVLCPEPYFKASDEIIDGANAIVGAFVFPFAITATDKKPIGYYSDNLEANVINEGDVESGVTIEIHATGNVTNPIIFKRETSEYFGLTYSLIAGDTVTITTSRGSKEVQLLRDGEFINLFNYVEEGSTWLQLSQGDNVFTYDADDDTELNMNVTFTHRSLFEGV